MTPVNSHSVRRPFIALTMISRWTDWSKSYFSVSKHGGWMGWLLRTSFICFLFDKQYSIKAKAILVKAKRVQRKSTCFSFCEESLNWPFDVVWWCCDLWWPSGILRFSYAYLCVSFVGENDIPWSSLERQDRNVMHCALIRDSQHTVTTNAPRLSDFVIILSFGMIFSNHDFVNGVSSLRSEVRAFQQIQNERN